MLNRDPQLKRERGYTDAKSFVRTDGSERLAGKDWDWRKSELWERCGGRCEQYTAKGPEGAYMIELSLHTTVYAHPSYFERCAKEAADPHHIKPRSKGRDDRLENLTALCRYHHDLLDKRKPRFSKKRAVLYHGMQGR